MRAVVETPVGSVYKYLLNDKTPELWVSRVLQNQQVFPFNYGFFPGTLEEDGDPLDCFICGPMLLPHSNVEVEIRGGLEVIDDRGRDTKLICCPVGYKGSYSTTYMLGILRDFLTKYKYETEKVVVGEELYSEAAHAVYENAVKAHLKEKALLDQLLTQAEKELGCDFLFSR